MLARRFAHTNEMKSRWKIRHIVYAVLLVLGVLYALPYERSHYQCLECRLYKNVTTYCGIPLTFYKENECSSWFSQAYPDHTHAWRRSGCTYRTEGCRAMFLCPRLHPVFRIKPFQQLQYLKSHSPEEREQLFTLLQSGISDDNEIAKSLIEDFLDGTPASHSTQQSGQQRAPAD